MDGRPRFDIEINTHNSENPALRRITSPAEISDACYDVLAQTMPNMLVNDVTVENTQLKVKDKLIDMIREKSGKEGLDVLVSAIADFLNDFSHNGALLCESYFGGRLVFCW